MSNPEAEHDIENAICRRAIDEPMTLILLDALANTTSGEVIYVATKVGKLLFRWVESKE